MVEGQEDIVKLTLGDKREIIPIDFVNMGWEAQQIIETIHAAALKELLRRPLHALWDWSVRTMNMFKHNNLWIVQNIYYMKEGDIKKLNGCGIVVRKEVFDVFHNELGLTLVEWCPRSAAEQYQWARHAAHK